MVTVFHLSTGLNVGGAETMLYRLVSRSDKKQFGHVVVSMLDVGPLGEQIKALGIPVYALGMRRGRPSLAALLRLTKLVRRERPDILQTWLYHADLFGLIAAKLAGASVVVWNLRASNVDMSQYRHLSGWTVRACARLSTIPRAVVVNSATGQAFHTQIGYHPREWVLIPNGIDDQQFRPDAVARRSVRQELGLEPEALLIGLIARFDPMKDHTTFLQAARLLLDSHPQTHFLLCGAEVTPENLQLSCQIETGHLQERVHLLGLRRDITRITAALDVATLSSSFGEGFSNVVGEAMACEVPCVVTDVGDSAQVVGDTGIVVPPKDPQALADGWRKLIEMGVEGRQRLGRAAREWIQQEYSLESVVTQYENLYLSLADSR